jgi:hypothetical protein
MKWDLCSEGPENYLTEIIVWELWLMSIIPACWEAEIGRTVIQDNPGVES